MSLAIIGNFTGQQIEQYHEMDKDLIELPYYFREVPEDVFGATLTNTQKPRIVSDEMTKAELLKELHTYLSQILHHYVDGHFDIEIGEIVSQPDAEEIRFALVEDHS